MIDNYTAQEEEEDLLKGKCTELLKSLLDLKELSDSQGYELAVECLEECTEIIDEYILVIKEEGIESIWGCFNEMMKNSESRD